MGLEKNKLHDLIWLLAIDLPTIFSRSLRGPHLCNVFFSSPYLLLSVAKRKVIKKSNLAQVRRMRDRMEGCKLLRIGRENREKCSPSFTKCGQKSLHCLHFLHQTT